MYIKSYLPYAIKYSYLKCDSVIDNINMYIKSYLPYVIKYSYLKCECNW